MGRGCRRIETSLAALLLLLACVAILGEPSQARSDPDVAQFLLKEAKKAISLRRWEEAVQKLERAREEDPALLEATYLLGSVHEKKSDPASALAAYRSFRDACAEREQTAKLERKLASYRKKAEKRIALLGKGEKELEKLQDGFAARILTFARTHYGKDPDIAADALRRLLTVLPGEKDAQRLLEEITGEALMTSTEEDGGKSPIPGIEAWDDLLRRKSIEPGKTASYGRKMLTLDNEGGSVHWHDGRTVAPGTFVYEIEYRVLEEYSPGYLLGLSFARGSPDRGTDPANFVTSFAQKSVLRIIQARGGRNVDVADATIKPARKGTWRHLVVAVDQRKVRVFVNGERMLNSSVPGYKDLSGPVGVFHQRCKVEIRKLRLGTKE